MFQGGNGDSRLWMIDADGTNEHLVDLDTFVGAPILVTRRQWIAWLH